MCLTQRIAFTEEKQVDYYLDMVADITERGFEFKEKIPQCFYVRMLDYCMDCDSFLRKCKKNIKHFKIFKKDQEGDNHCELCEDYHDIINELEKGFNIRVIKETKDEDSYYHVEFY